MQHTEQHNNERDHSRIRILVVDDQQLVRDGIVSLLDVQHDLTVVGTAANGKEAVEQAIALEPDVVLMDVRMPVMNGVEAVSKILEQRPSCCILMLTTFDDDAYVKDALRTGARGYLLKDMPVSDLMKAIKAVSLGIYQLDAAVIERLLSSMDPTGTTQQAESPKILSSTSLSPQTEHATESRLTRREQEILRLVATGATNREVAQRLIITEGTVKNHLAHLFSRLGLRDRTQAVIYAREHGLL